MNTLPIDLIPIILLISITNTIWIWSLIDIGRNKPNAAGLWIALVALTHAFGASIYLIYRYRSYLYNWYKLQPFHRESYDSPNRENSSYTGSTRKLSNNTDDFLTPVEQLSPREHEILHLIAKGHDNPQIAATLGLAKNTIRSHISNIYAKLDVHTRNEAVTWWKQHSHNNATNNNDSS